MRRSTFGVMGRGERIGPPEDPRRVRALIPTLRSDTAADVDVLGPTKILDVFDPSHGYRRWRLIAVRVVSTGEQLWIAKERILDAKGMTGDRPFQSRQSAPRPLGNRRAS